MLKKSILSLCIVIIFCMFCCCSNSSMEGDNGGDVSKVIKTIGDSTVYTTEDIESAMNTVTNYFSNTKGFQNCTLTELYYDEAISSSDSKEWAEQYGANEAIVLISSFDVGAENEHSGLDPNRTYNNFKWILVRPEYGVWTLETWGY